MGRFLDPLDLREDGEFDWILLSDFRYEDNAGIIHTVPKGFRTDLGSIPKPLWNILPPHGLVKKPAVIHDWYCVTKTISSMKAASLFLECMKTENIKYHKRYAMYWGVVIGGPHFKSRIIS